MAGFRLKPCCRRRLAILLIALGSLLLLIGIIFFMLNLSNDIEDMTEETTEDTTEPITIEQAVEDSDATEMVVEEENETASNEGVDEETATDEEATDEEKATDEETEVTGPTFFEGSYMTINSMTYMVSDGMIAEETEIPAFHTVSLIISDPGINPKTNEVSDNLRTILTAIPDREFSITVLVSTDSDAISEITPDRIRGIQWSMSYSEDAFRKTAREVLEDGTIVEKDAEDFNARYIGNEGVAEVEFFGPPGTKYYAIMVHDDTYSSLILP